MTQLEDKLRSSVDFIRGQLVSSSEIGLVLGSGLGDLLDALPVEAMIATADIPHYPRPSTEGHKGRLLVLKAGERRLLVFQGRTHFYEHNDIDAVLYPVHVAQRLGLKTLVVTNAAGGVNRTFRAGDIMVIVDQINLTAIPFTEEGVSSNRNASPYSNRLIEKTLALSASVGIPVRTGVYAGVKGPSYETAGEVEMIRRLGGDAVGMSTVLEVSFASRIGIEVLGISCISNLATGVGSSKLSHQEVTEVGKQMKQTLGALLTMLISNL